MKTTIDIANSLFKETKRVASKKGMTFKQIVESALRVFLDSQKVVKKPFQLKKHTFCGRGLVLGLSEGDWKDIRDRAYEGRGG